MEEQSVESFISEIFSMSKIPHHTFTPPCSDYEWLDLGLRTKLLGIDAEHTCSLLNKYFKELPSYLVLHLTDIFQFHYVFMRRVHSDEIYCIGPIIHEQVEQSFLEELLHSLHIPERMLTSIYNHYTNITFFPYWGLLDNFASICANNMYGKGEYETKYIEEKDFPDWLQIYSNYLRLPDKPFLNIQHIEDRYKTENELIQAVANGNEALAMKYTNKFSGFHIPQRLSSKLRDERDLCITLNTILRKAAERAGVHPIHIDSFSNSNIPQIEKLENSEQVLLFRSKMVKGYCRLVTKYSLKNYSQPIQKIMTCISTDLTADLSLKSLANQVNINPSYLSTLFKKEVGLTLTEYVNRSRIEFSKRLLADTGQPIKSIATQSGIPDIQYFTRMFKRITGMSPKAYRTQATEKNIYFQADGGAKI